MKALKPLAIVLLALIAAQPLAAAQQRVVAQQLTVGMSTRDFKCTVMPPRRSLIPGRKIDTKTIMCIVDFEIIFNADRSVAWGELSNLASRIVRWASEEDGRGRQLADWKLKVASPTGYTITQSFADSSGEVSGGNASATLRIYASPVSKSLIDNLSKAPHMLCAEQDEVRTIMCIVDADFAESEHDLNAMAFGLRLSLTRPLPKALRGWKLMMASTHGHAITGSL